MFSTGVSQCPGSAFPWTGERQHGGRGRSDSACVLIQSLTCCVALDKSFHFPEPQCPALKSEVNNNTDLTGLVQDSSK